MNTPFINEVFNMGKLVEDAKASSEIKRINERLKDLARNFGTDSKIYQQLQNTIINAAAVENRQARAYGKIAREVYGSVAPRITRKKWAYRKTIPTAHFLVYLSGLSSRPFLFFCEFYKRIELQPPDTASAQSGFPLWD